MEHVKRIYEALLNRNEEVSSKNEIINIIKEYKKKFRSDINITNLIKYLSRHDYIKRIFKSFYYINSVDERKRGFCFYEDKELLFTVLEKIGIRWYIGLGSASYISGKTWQVPRVLHILNNKISGKRKILRLEVAFSKIKESLFFGLKKGKTKKGIPYHFSKKAKTSLDMVYLGFSDKLMIDNGIKRYIKYYPKWVGKK